MQAEGKLDTSTPARTTKDSNPMDQADSVHSTPPTNTPVDLTITGEVRAMKLFVAAKGASNYTYAEACPNENLSDWIGLHANLFRYLGGVPKFVVCDNLKAAVTNPDRYDPGINRTYAEMAGHYGTAILAARPRRPKDKTIASYCTLF
jgi:transposase